MNYLLITSLKHGVSCLSEKDQESQNRLISSKPCAAGKPQLRIALLLLVLGICLLSTMHQGFATSVSGKGVALDMTLLKYVSSTSNGLSHKDYTPCGGAVGGTGSTDDYDGDGVCNDIDVDDDNDGILDDDETCYVPGALSYEYYNILPAGSSVDGIPNTGADNTGLSSNFDVSTIQNNHSPGDQDNYAIRFTGRILLSSSDTYTFYLSSDDGSKLFIDGSEIIDNDGIHPFVEVSASVALSAGYYDIEVEFFQVGGSSQLALEYASLSNPTKIPVPFSILNNVGDCSSGSGNLNQFNLDSDDDGIPDIVEAGGQDNDNDGKVDGTFTDTDNDGWSDTFDPDNGGTPLTPIDTDSDGLENRIDTDSDGDSVPDIVEAGGVDINLDGVVDNFTDTDGDGWANTFDADNGGTVLADIDTDSDGIKDRLDLDSDNDGLGDINEGCTVSGQLDFEYFSDVPVGYTVDNIPTTNPFATGKRLTPNSNLITGLSQEVDPSGGNETFSVRFTGFLNIPDTRTYTFEVLSSDGAKLYLDGNLIVDNDGLQGSIGSSSGNVALTNGQHTITLEFFYDSGLLPFLSLRYFLEGGQQAVIPSNWYSSPTSLCDTDGDGFDNRVDLDSDNDGLTDIIEGGGTDVNGDGLVDGVFTDTDNDGWSDTYDPDHGTPMANPDTDGDTYPNRIDLDSDNDGLPDNFEAHPTLDYVAYTTTDIDNDGLKDVYDLNAGGVSLNPFNTDGTDAPDYLDLDSDNDGVFDIDESTGLLTDGNNDGKTDGFVGINGLDNAHGTDDYAQPIGNFQGADVVQTYGDADADYLRCPDGDIDFRDPLTAGDCYQAQDDFDNDGIVNAVDLDDDDDGLMDIEEHIKGVGFLNYEFYDGLPNGNSVDNIPTSGALFEFITSSFSPQPTQSAIPGSPTTNYSIRYYGGINIPATDTYTFYTASDDGSKLFIDGVEIVSNDGVRGGLQEEQGSVALSAGFHEFKVEYFYASSGTPGLSVSYSSNTISKTIVPFSILYAINTTSNDDLDSILPNFDLDSDDDGIPDIVEAGGVDADGDGKVDGIFTDTDGDGWSDTYDPDNGGTRLADTNSDGDNRPDRLDLDSDNDGIPDLIEAGGSDANGNGMVENTSLTDTNSNGWSDLIEPTNGGTLLADEDADGDGFKNRADTDSDQDGIADIIEASGIDTNDDGRADDITDLDNDGWANLFDADNGGAVLADQDTDQDSYKDRLDYDSDNDGLSDIQEFCAIAGFLNYEYYSDAPTGNTVDNIPTSNPFAQGGVMRIDNVLTLSQEVDPGGGLTSFAIRYSGFINIPVNDTYTFSLTSGDGSKLYIDGTLVTDNDGLHNAFASASNSTILTKGRHTITIEYFHASATTPVLAVNYSTSTQTQIKVPMSWMSIKSNNCDADADGFDNRIDLDSDNDGLPDIVEAGGIDTDGNGLVDGTFTDTDNDGWANTYDPDNGGTELTDPDTDNDIVPNRIDLDSDNDGIPDILEIGNADTNNDGRADASTDTDNDGWADTFDSDNGGTNPTDPDTDGDGLNDRLDLDSDFDGIPDIVEAGGIDADANGAADTTTDSDNDGWTDTFDADNSGTALADLDTDGDGFKNRLDLDSDNDGISDIIEAQPTIGYTYQSITDTDGDGISDNHDPDNGGTSLSNPVNTDGADNPDYLDLDSNNDGVFDIDAVNTNLGASSGQFTIALLQNNGGCQIIFVSPGYSDPQGSFYLLQSGLLTFDGRIKDFDNDYLQSGDLDYRDNYQGVPGGVSANLRLWLRGDETSPNWNDLSGNDVNISFTGSPTLSGLINYQPSYTFSGSQSSNTDLNINASTRPNLSMIAVYLPTQDNAGSVWGEKTSSSTNARYIIDAATASQNQALSTGSSFESDIDQLYGTNQLSLATVIYQDQGTNNSQVYLNGALKRSFTSSFSGTTNTLQIGASGDDNNHLNGQVAELIVYDQLLNSGQERKRIESYLALKYGITMSSDTDGDDISFEDGEGDYILRRVTGETNLIIWDASDNSQFHHNVAGIFRDPYSNLTQKQSKSSNSDAIVTIGLDADMDGLESTNADNPSTISDDLALVWGHDGEPLYDQSENIDFDPLQVISRLNREWRVRETTISNQSIGEVIVQFDISGLLGPTGVGTNDESQVVLLVDQDGDFSAGSAMITQSYVTENDGLVNFQIDFQDGYYFTLASNEDNALPITMLSFDAKLSENMVQLDWSTANEQNSSHFTVERSKNGTTYESIGQVQAAGESTTVRAYRWNDIRPLPGNNYYRLKSHDITGETEYSEVRNVRFEGNSTPGQPYPNPVQRGQIVTLNLPEVTALNQVQLFAIDGKKIQTPMTIDPQNQLKIKTQKLPNGIYLLSVKLDHEMIKFKILIKD